MSTSANLATAVRARFNHHQARIYLAEKYQNQLTIVSQGGTWTVTPELLTILKIAPESFILLDDNERPTMVDSAKLYREALDAYEAVMTAWRNEFIELEKNR